MIQFVYGTTDGDELSSRTTRGRATAILFVATYDLASQVQAKQLQQILKSHTPRINAGAIVLEGAEYATLADVFKQSLALSYPVAMADAATLAGRGPFGRIAELPTVFVLDRSGREVWRHSGPADPAAIDAALASAGRRGSAWSP